MAPTQAAIRSTSCRSRRSPLFAIAPAFQRTVSDRSGDDVASRLVAPARIRISWLPYAAVAIVFGLFAVVERGRSVLSQSAARDRGDAAHGARGRAPAARAAAAAERRRLSSVRLVTSSRRWRRRTRSPVSPTTARSSTRSTSSWRAHGGTAVPSRSCSWTSITSSSSTTPSGISSATRHCTSSVRCCGAACGRSTASDDGVGRSSSRSCPKVMDRRQLRLPSGSGRP